MARSKSFQSCILSLAVSVAAPALAQPLRPTLVDLERATLQRPLRVGRVESPQPAWTAEGLWPSHPGTTLGLGRAAVHGRPAFDPSSSAWYASAEGLLVRLEPDGALRVVADRVRGHDVDVRAAAGLAVSYEPEGTIVLHRFGPAGTTHHTLASDHRFFAPRLSPDASQLLVSGADGRAWIAGLERPADGAEGRQQAWRDLGPGIDPAWHPDGRRVVLARVEDDGHVTLASNLVVVDVRSGAAQVVARTEAPALQRPAVSPDGRWIALADLPGGDVVVVPFPAVEGRRP